MGGATAKNKSFILRPGGAAVFRWDLAAGFDMEPGRSLADTASGDGVGFDVA